MTMKIRVTSRSGEGTHQELEVPKDTETFLQWLAAQGTVTVHVPGDPMKEVWGGRGPVDRLLSTLWTSTTERTMIETGVVVTGIGPVFWHLPKGRTGGSLPDSRALWEILWEHRREPFLGFAHSHPGSGVPGPSWTDLTTFSGVENGLGRRLTWWITSSTHMIGLNFEGPDKYNYGEFVVDNVPGWADQLREYSDKHAFFIQGVEALKTKEN